MLELTLEDFAFDVMHPMCHKALAGAFSGRSDVIEGWP